MPCEMFLRDIALISLSHNEMVIEGICVAVSCLRAASVLSQYFCIVCSKWTWQLLGLMQETVTVLHGLLQDASFS